jgi:GntR family transcriptional regulator/MocR family aminotransferase
MVPLQQILSDLAGAPPRRLGQTMYALMVQAIVEGRLSDGMRLPASRVLARDLGVSRNTVINVYDRLMIEGYAAPRRGHHFHVTHAAERSRPRSPAIAEQHYARHVAANWKGAEKANLADNDIVFDLLPGVPDTSVFPGDVWRRLCARAARSHRFGEQAYAETQGREALRRAIAGHLSLSRAVACKPADIVVTGGTQPAVDLLCRVLVTPGETIVAVEDPGYPFAIRAFEKAGAQVVRVPVDAEGLVVAKLPDTVDLILVAPSHQFPLGHVMSPDRRRELIAYAAASGALILEDDYLAEFPVAGKPADALQSLDQHESVFYIGTFSKCMFPELRLGFILAPKWALPPLLAAKQLIQHENPRLEQDALAAFIAEGHLARHIRKLREAYRVKGAAVTEALRRHCAPWIDAINPDGVAYLTVQLREDIKAAAVASRCRQKGLRIMPLSSDGAGVLNGLVIGLGRIKPDQIGPAMTCLGACLAATQAAAGTAVGQVDFIRSRDKAAAFQR